MARRVQLLCAGAAKGLVLALQEAFEGTSGCQLIATFGAVGALREQFDGGAPCDAIVLTRTMLDALGAAGRVDPASLVDLGWVPTGVAVPVAAPDVRLTDAPQLQALLQRSAAIYLPDPERATAGIHAIRVLRELGQARPERLRTHPNGAAAMSALARDGDATSVGITQVSEILYTPGLRLLGPLPPPHGLATLYSAAVARGSTEPSAAARLVGLLSAPEQSQLRERSGFDARPPQ